MLTCTHDIQLNGDHGVDGLLISELMIMLHVTLPKQHLSTAFGQPIEATGKAVALYTSTFPYMINALWSVFLAVDTEGPLCFSLP